MVWQRPSSSHASDTMSWATTSVLAKTSPGSVSTTQPLSGPKVVNTLAPRFSKVRAPST